jgi:hypothetical protein
MNQALSRQLWNQIASNALVECPFLLADGVENKHFHLVFRRLPDDRLLSPQDYTCLKKRHPNYSADC